VFDGHDVVLLVLKRCVLCFFKDQTYFDSDDRILMKYLTMEDEITYRFEKVMNSDILLSYFGCSL